MRRSSPLKKQMADQKQRWMRTFEAECMRLRPEWADPRNRPQDFWDSATYLFNESYTPFAAAQKKTGAGIKFLGDIKPGTWRAA